MAFRTGLQMAPSPADGALRRHDDALALLPNATTHCGETCCVGCMSSQVPASTSVPTHRRKAQSQSFWSHSHWDLDTGCARRRCPRAISGDPWQCRRPGQGGRDTSRQGRTAHRCRWSMRPHACTCCALLPSCPSVRPTACPSASACASRPAQQRPAQHPEARVRPALGAHSLSQLISANCRDNGNGNGNVSAQALDCDHSAIACPDSGYLGPRCPR